MYILLSALDEATLSRSGEENSSLVRQDALRFVKTLDDGGAGQIARLEEFARLVAFFSRPSALTALGGSGNSTIRRADWVRDVELSRCADEVNALAGALARGVDDLEPEPFGDVRAAARVGQQFALGVLDVRQPVDVELKDLGGVLDAQPVTGAQVLVDPDAQRLSGHLTPPSTLAQGTPWPDCGPLTR